MNYKKNIGKIMLFLIMVIISQKNDIYNALEVSTDVNDILDYKYDWTFTGLNSVKDVGNEVKESTTDDGEIVYKWNYGGNTKNSYIVYGSDKSNVQLKISLEGYNMPNEDDYNYNSDEMDEHIEYGSYPRVTLVGIKSATFKFTFLDKNGNELESRPGYGTLKDLDWQQGFTFGSGIEKVYYDKDKNRDSIYSFLGKEHLSYDNNKTITSSLNGTQSNDKFAWVTILYNGTFTITFFIGQDNWKNGWKMDNCAKWTKSIENYLPKDLSNAKPGYADFKKYFIYSRGMDEESTCIDKKTKLKYYVGDSVAGNSYYRHNLGAGPASFGSGTFSFGTETTLVNSCSDRLKTIIKDGIYKDDVYIYKPKEISLTSKQKAELYKLYSHYKNQGKNYNLLLNFDNYKGEGISCSTIKLEEKTSLSCKPGLKLIYESYKSHPIWYLSNDNSSNKNIITIKDSDKNNLLSGNTVKCGYNLETINSIFYSGVSTIAGTSIWESKEGDPVFKVNITKTCMGFNINDEASKKIKDNFWTSDEPNATLTAQQEQFKLSDNTVDSKITNSLMNNGIITGTKTITFGYGDDNTIYYKKGSGEYIRKSDTGFDNSDGKYLGPDYGFPTSITKSGGKVNFNLKVSAGSLVINSNADCKYKTTKDDDKETCIAGDDACPKVKEKLNVNFRIIKTSTGSEAFPGYNGKGRNTGLNWCSYAGKDKNGKNVVLNSKEVIRYNLLQKCLNGASTDESKKVCNVLYSDGIESIDNIDNACNNSNDVVTKEIVNSNNSYNSKDETPLISLTLNASNIKNIRSYNSKKTYDDWDIECSDEKGCRSAFVSNLLNKVNNYASINAASCEKGSNRKYCVGGNL